MKNKILQPGNLVKFTGKNNPNGCLQLGLPDHDVDFSVEPVELEPGLVLLVLGLEQRDPEAVDICFLYKNQIWWMITDDPIEFSELDFELIS